MSVVIGVRFKTGGKSYYFDPQDFEILKNGSVVVETSRGVELGEITMEKTEIPDADIIQPLKKVLRLATEEDMERARENREKEKWALGVCQEKIAQFKLDMKLIDVEYTFDNNKILFYFTSDGRVDFRELVKDLASIFKTRIELRQIGVRDEAKILGGIGICGRCLCCNSFLGDFHPVSVKMAKEQGLSLNPAKISGSCGRLMCCLKYEQDAYEYLLSKTPGVGAVVDTGRGKGTVVGVSLLKGLLKVRLDEGDESNLIECNVEEIKLIKHSPKRYREKMSAGADTRRAESAGERGGPESAGRSGGSDKTNGFDATDGVDSQAEAEMLEDAVFERDPGESMVTEIPGVSMATEIPGVSTATAIHEESAVAESNDESMATEIPDVSTATAILGVSMATEIPGVSTATEIPGVSTATEIPGVSTATEILGVSMATDIPGESMATDIPGESIATEIPVVSVDDAARVGSGGSCCSCGSCGSVYFDINGESTPVITPDVTDIEQLSDG